MLEQFFDCDTQLEQKQNNPPSFLELLLLLHTEEDKQAAKATQMKQHLVIAKPKVQAYAQAARINETNDYDLQIQVNSISTTVEQIKKQISSFSGAKGEKFVKSKTSRIQN